MLDFILEKKEALFQKSIQNYLKDFQSTRSADLNQVWNSFTTTAKAEEGIDILPEGITFREIIEAWLCQRGHPLIYVSRNKDDRKLYVTQVVRKPILIDLLR